MPRPDGLPTIGLAIIARNEEATLGDLLDSVGFTDMEGSETEALGVPATGEEWEGAFGLYRHDAAVDCVVVCDTGSTDKTRELARVRGCRVVEFPWTDNFSEAREASYAALPDVDFTIWADCDDVLSGAEQLRLIAASLPLGIVGTVHRYDYAQDEAGNTTCELWRERLVRKDAIKGWLLPIHEVLDLDGQVMLDALVTWHHRLPADRERDPERNYKILRADAQRSLDAGEEVDARTLCYIGTEALALGRLAEARAYLTGYLERPDTTWAEERCQVAHKLSIAWRNGEDADLGKSRDAAHEAIYVRPDWADGYLDLAELAIMATDWERAVKFCDLAEGSGKPQTLLIINPLEYDYQPKLMRAVALGAMGELEPALAATQEVLAVTPQRNDLHVQAAALAEQLKRKQTRDLVLTLREVLVRHDENAKARALMECVPYFIESDPIISQARLDQREMTLHADDPEVYSSYYRDNPGEAPFELQGVDIDKAHEAFYRVKFLRDGLDVQAAADDQLAQELGVDDDLRAELRILDLSANDGWMLANLAEGGYGVEGALHGMDLNAGAVDRARDREQLSGPPHAFLICDDLHNATEHFTPGSYDAVVLFETIEHVPDPRATIELCCRMVKPGGRVYVSTPDGAYERGAVEGWAVVESKGHLRAITPAQLCGWLMERGVVRGLDVEQRVVVAELEPMPRAGRIDFVTGPVEALPEKIVHGGQGGSETALCKMAEHFARRGYDVRVYAGEGPGGLRGDHMSVEGEELTGNVLYEPHTAWNPGSDADLCVISRMPHLLDYTIKAPRRLLWLHDADYGDQLNEVRARNATDVVVLSQFQRRLLNELYPFLASHPGLFVSRNGIESSFYVGELPKKRPWAVYSSSPDRGLEILLGLWPEVCKRVPHAQLHFGYAPVYQQFAAAQPHLRALSERIDQLVELCPEGSVLAFEGLGQLELAELYKQARAWAYPSWHTPGGDPFPEISCISAMEAQAGGAYPVTSEYGALVETVREGSLIPFGRDQGDVGVPEPEWHKRFIDSLVATLKGQRTLSDNVRANVIDECDWSGVADEWQLAFLTSADRATIGA